MSCSTSVTTAGYSLTVDSHCGVDQPSTVSTRINSGDSLRFRMALGLFGPDQVAPEKLYWQLFDPKTEGPVTPEAAEVLPTAQGFDFIVNGFVNEGPAKVRRIVLQLAADYPGGYRRTVMYDVWVVKTFGMTLPGIVVETEGTAIHMDFLSAMIEGVTQ